MLTGEAGDPYPFFAGLLDHVYASSATTSIPSPVSDNPFPLAQRYWRSLLQPHRVTTEARLSGPQLLYH